MAVSNKKKKQIKRNYPAQSIQQLAEALQLSPREVEQAIKEMGLEPGKKKAGSGPEMPVKKKFPGLDLAIAVLVGLAALTVYFNALQNGFVSDDNTLILDNPAVMGKLNFEKIFERNFFDYSGTQRRGFFYRPLITLSYALDHSFWKEKAIGYHLTNIIFHSLASVLVFLCFYLWSRGSSLLKDSSRAIGAFAGLLFALHPAHTQSVTWIAGRTDLFATFFCLLSFYFYLQARARGLRLELILLIFALVSFFLALLCKENAAVFPLLLVLADYAREREFGSIFKPRRIFTYGAFFAAVLVYLLIRQKVLGYTLGSEKVFFVWYPEGKGDVSRLVTVFKIFFYYLQTLTYPLHLCFECRLLPSPTWGDAQIFYSIAAVILVLALGVFSLFRLPWLGLSVFWIFLALLPVSNIIKMVRIREIAMEHFLYLSSVGFCLAMAVAIEGMRQGLEKRYGKVGKGLVLSLFIAILVFYGALAWQRNYTWKNDRIIWSDAIKKSPDKNRAEYNVGNEYYKAGEKAKAALRFKRAVMLMPSDADSHYNLAVTLSDLGRLDEAISEYWETVRLNPKKAEAHINLGYALQEKQDWEGAIREYQEALKANPKIFTALHNLGRLYLELGRCDEAWQVYSRMGTDAPSSYAKSLKSQCPR